MTNPQLLDYIKQQLQQGVSREQIKGSLLGHGWIASDIEEGFNVVTPAPSAIPPAPSPASNINTVSNSQVFHPQSSISQQLSVVTLPGVGAIFGQAWSVYKKRFRTFLGIMIAPTLLSFVAGGVSGFTAVFATKFAVPILFIILGIILIVIALFILVTWGQTALLYAIKDNQEGIGIKEAYRRGWHKIVSGWWVVILLVLIIMGGLLLLVVPGIIFFVWFSFAMFILIAEDLKGMNALLKSREYVRGKWGSIFWRILFIGIIYLIISILVSIIIGLIFYFLKIPFGKEIANSIDGLFLTPFWLTYMFLLYSNLKAVKGEVVFAPTKGKKAVFIFVGLIGLLLPILLGILLASLGSARAISRDAIRQSNLNSIRIGLEFYYNDHSSYPASLNELSNYLPSTLTDPSTHEPYQYQLEQSGKNYQLCAQLESTKTQECSTSAF